MSSVGSNRIAGKPRKVEEYNLVELWHGQTDKVNDRLRDGWELYGSPVVEVDGSIYQAMVKYAEPEVVKLPIGEFLYGKD